MYVKMNGLYIKGHSGCNLSIREDNGQLYVSKYCKASYAPRLKKQYEKQSNMERFYSECGVSIPHPEFDDDTFTMTMPYISGRSFIDYFERSTVDDIRTFTNTLVKIIELELDKCEMSNIPINVFSNKVSSIMEKVLERYPEDRIIFEPVLEFINKHDKVEMPVGVCHGDLTFSNMIFADANIWLIDFLDSFVETPLQDVVKIRQDSTFYWSLLMADTPYNETHVKMVMKHIDDTIDKYFSTKDWYVKYYGFMQYVNLLRILPYADDDKYKKVKAMLSNVRI